MPRHPLDSAERGFLLETWILHELRAVMSYQNLGGQLHYWRTPSGSEVDFIWTRGRHAIGVEVKAATTWRGEYGAAVKDLIATGMLTDGYGVYTGTIEHKDGPMHIWPIQRFLKELNDGHVLG
jgi:predicted AAA+ superfamily ATPase